MRRRSGGRYPAHAKLRSMLTAAAEELHDVPLYYSLHSICKTLHTTPPAADVFRSALVNAGAHVSTVSPLLPPMTMHVMSS